MSNGRKRDHQTNMAVLQKYREATAKSGSSSHINKSATDKVINNPVITRAFKPTVKPTAQPPKPIKLKGNVDVDLYGTKNKATPTQPKSTYNWQEKTKKVDWLDDGEDKKVKTSLIDGVKRLPEDVSKGTKAITRGTADAGKYLGKNIVYGLEAAQAGTRNAMNWLSESIYRGENKIISRIMELSGVKEEEVPKKIKEIMQKNTYLADKDREAVVWENDQTQKKREKLESEKPNLPGAVNSTIEFVGQAAQMTPTVLMSVANPAYGTAYLAMESMGRNYAEAVADGADYNEATTYAVGATVVEIALEKIGGNKMFGGKTLTDAAMDKAAQRIIKNKTAQKLIRGALENNAEGIEEVATSYIQPLIKKIAYADTYEAPTSDEVIESYLGGVIGSAVWQGAGTAVNKIGEKASGKLNLPPAVEKPVNTLPPAGAFKEQNGNFDSLPEAGAFKENIDLPRNMEELNQKANTPKEVQNVMDSGEETGIDFEKDYKEYPYNMKTVIKDYVNYSNPMIRGFVEKVMSGNATSKDKIFLNHVRDRAANDIKNILGVDVSGYKVALDGTIVKHIAKRHGLNDIKGKADNSMSNISDWEKIQYVLENYDNIDYGGKSSAYTTVKENGKMGLADTVVYSKKINGTFYVVEAVPITKANTLQVTSAYINKKGAMQVSDVQDPKETSETPSAHTPSTDNISQPENIVNSNDMQNNENNSQGQYSFADKTDVEAVNRIKDLNSSRARTPDESRELVELLYNQFGKDAPEFADVRNDIASPIYSTRSDENVSHIVNNLIANENYLYEVKKEAGKIKRALEPNEKIMGYIDKIAKGEASIEDFSPLLGLDKYQALIDAKTKVYEVENNGIKSFKERTRLGFKDTVDDFIKNSENWKDKTAFGWQINTAERNAYDTMGEDAKKFIETFITPMKQNEAQKIRYINEHKQTIKDLDLSPEEFETTMKYGEGIIRNASPKIQNAAKVFNEIAEQIKNDVNATLVLNGYKPIDNPKINLNANEFRDALSVLTGEKQYEQMLSDKIRQFINIAERYGIDSIQYDSKGKVTASVNIPYFPHGEVLNNLQQVKKAMGFSLEVTELPGEITGRTEEFKPNKKWVGNLEKRKGKKTDYDIRNWDNYINNISEVIYHTNDITKLRLLENGLRSKYSQSQIDEEVKIARNLMTNEELEDFFATLDQKRDELTEHNNLINWLNEYTNIIAGKKHSADRNMEKNILGRKFYNLMTTFERNWAVNQVGGNVSSVLNQFSQLTSLVAEKNPIDVITAVGTCFFGDKTALNESDFMTTKDGALRLSTSGIEKIANVMFKLPMTAENITSKLVWQTAYNEAIRKGKTEAQAKVDANKYASQIMADRTKIGLPTIFASKNILTKFLTTFQIEPANTFFHYIKDLPREAKGKGIMWLIKSALATALMNWLFNKGKEELTGSGNVTLDPMETGIKIYQWVADKEGVEFADVLKSVGENVANLPFMQTPMALLGFDDVGQIPMTNMIPDIPETVDKFKNGRYADGTWDVADVVINSFNPLGGYSQAKKTIKGIGSVMKGAEYTPSGNLRYPIEQSAGNYVRGALFGKYSLPENKEFYDENKKALTADETKEYEYRVQQGENSQDVYNDIYQRKMDNAAESDANKAYREKTAGMVNEFDYGTSLKLDKFLDEYKKQNPEATSIGVPTASKSFSYDGRKYNLTEEQCAELQNMYNDSYYNGIKDLINDETLDNEQKYNKISAVRKNVQNSVKKQFAKEVLGYTNPQDELDQYMGRASGTNQYQKELDEYMGRSTSGSKKNKYQQELEDYMNGAAISSATPQKNPQSNGTKNKYQQELEAYMKNAGNSNIGFKNYKVTNNNGGKHKGMDFAVPEGTAIQSTTSGVVTEVLSLRDSYGKFIVVKDASGNNHYYAHLSGFNCKIGDKVNRGQVIGYSGNTGNSSGPHLHYEVRHGDDYGKQIDPRSYL